MFTKMSRVLAVMLLLILVPARWDGAYAQTPEPGERPQERQVRDDDLRATNISLIDSPTPTCYRPQLQSNTCFVNWSYMAVSTSSPATIISMILTIDSRVRANYQGYFQSSMFISSTLHSEGFQVACGPAGEGGTTGVGYAHEWTLKARDSAGQETTNTGTVTCPALDPIQLFLPVVLKQ
jgi:hypothetical protein